MNEEITKHEPSEEYDCDEGYYGGDDEYDVFTTKHFIECCENNYFIDDDGIGYYSDGKRETDIKAIPSEVFNGNALNWPFVNWYNK